MNSKSKIILGLTSILAVSAGVAATSTFAWFSTSRTTSVSVTGLTLRSNNGQLWCEAAASNDANKGGVTVATGKSGSPTQTPVIEGDGGMYDISGDGKTFYQPQWAANNVNTSTGVGTTAVSMRAANNDTAGNLAFREFTLTFHNGVTGVTTSTDPSVAVYVDNNSLIKATTNETNDVAAAACTRVAILDSTKANVLFYWQNSSEATSGNPQYGYIATAATGTSLYTVDGYTLGDASTIAQDATTTTLYHNVLGSVPAAITDGKNAQLKQKIISQIDPLGSVSVVVRIWCEGTCATCSTTAAANGSVDVALGFSAI